MYHRIEYNMYYIHKWNLKQDVDFNSSYGFNNFNKKKKNTFSFNFF